MDNNEVICQMASKMLEKFLKYWDEIHGIMGVAAVLDPTYKFHLVKFYFQKIYDMKASVVTNLTHFIASYPSSNYKEHKITTRFTYLE